MGKRKGEKKENKEEKRKEMKEKRKKAETFTQAPALRSQHFKQSVVRLVIMSWELATPLKSVISISSEPPSYQQSHQTVNKNRPLILGVIQHFSSEK